jgi:hypothetical protein
MERHLKVIDALLKVELDRWYGLLPIHFSHYPICTIH